MNVVDSFSRDLIHTNDTDTSNDHNIIIIGITHNDEIYTQQVDPSSPDVAYFLFDAGHEFFH